MIELQNDYLSLESDFYKSVLPEGGSQPKLILLNEQLSKFLNLDDDYLKSHEGILFLAGNSVSNIVPICLAYAGHQFGRFVPLLGDGRAHLLGTIHAHHFLYDIQLKGSGKTPFSRRGDGKSPLGPALREYIVSEYMNAVGIPTTRSLAVVETGDMVEREEFLKGGIVVRVASSHLRIGTFEYFYYKNDYENLKKCADYAIKRHYEFLSDEKNKYYRLFMEVMNRQAELISKWLGVGFIHGVMNTDNTSISGETIDYGPCAFMDYFNFSQVYSYIDTNGRYAYMKQPYIIKWNLQKWGETLKMFFADESQDCESLLRSAMNEFDDIFKYNFLKVFGGKLGFVTQNEEIGTLIEEFLSLMNKEKVDFTNTFIILTNYICNDLNEASVTHLFAEESQQMNFWLIKWKVLLEKYGESTKEDIKMTLKKNNPLYIPRNHIVEKVLKDAEENNLEPLQEFLNILSHPFENREGARTLYYSAPPSKDEIITNTFCGT